jgi:hypothetical protein
LQPTVQSTKQPSSQPSDQPLGHPVSNPSLSLPTNLCYNPPIIHLQDPVSNQL